MSSNPQMPTPAAGASVLQISGRPIELLAPAALVAAPGVYLVIDAIRNFNDFRRLIDVEARLGWGFMLMLIASLLLGLVLLWIATGVARGDRGARGAVYVLSGSWLLGYILAPDLNVLSGRGGASLTGLACLIVAGLALAVLPAAQPAFAQSQDGQPASIRMLFNAGSVIAVLLAVCGAGFLLVGSGPDVDKNRSIAVGVIFGLAAALTFVLGPMVRQKNPAGRLIGSAAMLALIVASFALLGQRFFIAPVQLITFLAVAWISLWVINDARAWFGDPPLQTKATDGGNAAAPAGGVQPTIMGDAAPTVGTVAPTYAPPPPPPAATVAPTITGMAPAAVTDEATLPATENATPAAPEPAGAGSVDCTRCGTPIDPDDRFCRGCGASAQDVRPVPPPPTCTGCGNELVSGDRFCPNCGTRVPE